MTAIETSGPSPTRTRSRRRAGADAARPAPARRRRAVDGAARAHRHAHHRRVRLAGRGCHPRHRHRLPQRAARRGHGLHHHRRLPARLGRRRPRVAGPGAHRPRPRRQPRLLRRLGRRHDLRHHLHRGHGHPRRPESTRHHRRRPRPRCRGGQRPRHRAAPPRPRPPHRARRRGRHRVRRPRHARHGRRWRSEPPRQRRSADCHPGSTTPPAARLVRPSTRALPSTSAERPASPRSSRPRPRTSSRPRLISLPHWEDYRTAEAEGFASIGDGGTGSEHFINWEYAADDDVLDPARPESLDVRHHGRRASSWSQRCTWLRQAPRSRTCPSSAAPLTQWHIHDNLCFFNPPDGAGPASAASPRRRGLRAPAVPVPGHPDDPRVDHAAPVRSVRRPRGRRCGQILEGEERLCDTAHGH